MRLQSLSLLLLFLLPLSLTAQAPQDKVWLGVSVEEADQATGPVTLVEVIPGSPAAKAGLKVGDQVFQVGSHKVKDLDGFMESVLAMKPGSTQAFAIRRKGKTMRLRVKLGSQAQRIAMEKRKRQPKVAKRTDKPRAARPKGPGRLGVTLEEDGMAIRIVEVEKGGPAAKAGLRSGDVIVKARGREARDLDRLIDDIKKSGAGASYPLEIRRRGRSQKLTARLGGYGSQAAAPGRTGAAARPKRSAAGRRDKPKTYVAKGKSGKTSPLVGRVVAQAKKTGRLALILFFDPESDASKLTSKSLANPKVRNILKSGYVGTKINVLEQGRVADQYGVMATPHFLVLDGAGKTVGRFTGYQPADRLAARLQRYLSARHIKAPVAAKPTSRKAAGGANKPRAVEARPSSASEVQRNQRILRQMQGERRRMEKLLQQMKELEKRLKKQKGGK